MAIHAISSILGIAASNPSELEFATDRLREEHDRLRYQLRILETSAKEVGLLNDPAKGIQVLHDLRQQTSAFVQALERHAEWEDQELFPFLQDYFDRQPVPSITPSFWVLEKDHQLALLFIQTFHEAVIDLTPLVAKKQLVEATAHLIQACLILNDHLTMEEQLVFPLAEKVLTDLEYFFS
ncbi:hemerythrin domain-containing protein [Paenibacillus sp. GCM10023248]|uniref:hemerythrin domain-containing protein n=1 Tax=unclassified Paenibacillus TaxID=185978 RepID=UPI002377F502|nr:hemerythrin domain-containing protein [Paenibacillus sp. MAHUQ-63]MDD9266768.1 hemerythrin domain-containing protein [Paenibacillus sp. MAHUQ-63]